MPIPRNRDRRLRDFARGMRKAPTIAEGKLWILLSDKKLCGHRFRRQHTVGHYILDFYCAKQKLAVELDGGQHTELPQVQYDDKRTQRLNALGIRVLRFWDNDVLSNPDGVADSILQQLEAIKPPPQSSP